ncbi:WD repeat-containing protein 41-like [Rhopilema esculentum]|uniref:WD repeat-containing protein 41-like n=1 Tax=Rhopilema esculentum TaxID=499914 RepID=UPI0031D38A91
MLRDFLGFFRSDSKEAKNDRDQTEAASSKVPEITDDQPRNPYTEIKILSGHSDRIHLATIIDESRILTAAQDNTVAVWDSVNGNLLFKLYGHTKPINCVCVIHYDVSLDEEIKAEDLGNETSRILLTASFDKSIRLWSLCYGNCLKVITEHNYAVKCFIKLRGEETEAHYCCAGDHLSIWDENMKLLHTYKRNNPNFIQSLISIKDKKIVTATDQYYLDVYCIEKSSESVEIQYSRKLPTHRESITCLINISDAMFASASLDGTIMVWTTYHLLPTRQFNSHENYRDSEKKKFLYSVKHLFALEQRYIFAAIANGFFVYDTISDKCLVKQPNAHSEEVNHLALIGDGSVLATCSLDGTTRLWGHRTPVSSSDISALKSAVTPLERIIGKRVKSLRDKPTSLELIGECAGHTDSVQLIVSCGKEGFITCGLNDLVILWKNGALQMENENKILEDILKETDFFQLSLNET